MCGEKHLCRDLVGLLEGSPPRVRGKGGLGGSGADGLRITPACAGKSTSHANHIANRKDHPRVCGEKFRAYALICDEWGSPPRVRGKAIHTNMEIGARRITPACAGKSFSTNRPDFEEKDHPRVCGEKS